ncbi:hypothetical protein OJAV_G00110040 [Oryzias javanicus]|uniref:Uncharacterized protein n=1 Tax=Oryzias javanicus TaxID=123683 RepID=A0A3S2PPX6_ORYJA|nr:hypothetical protein OJAV_G00110040 [Oryzias javanicus]
MCVFKSSALRDGGFFSTGRGGGVFASSGSRVRRERRGSAAPLFGRGTQPSLFNATRLPSRTARVTAASTLHTLAPALAVMATAEQLRRAAAKKQQQLPRDEEPP